MPQLGPLEIMTVAVIALVVFGPHRLPEIARKMGQVISEVKRQANELTSEFKSGLDLDVDDDDDDDDDIPESTTFGGLYANEDDSEEEPSEPPLTAGADSGSAASSSNGAPAEEAGETPVGETPEKEHTAEVTAGEDERKPSE